ncbi:MAG: phytanoyl-CoA dioxygenase family protein [Bryobacterales bacterium]|nr:phytanoyl-CoA dioxygenase family protein [Bryobacterales bacterium]
MGFAEDGFATAPGVATPAEVDRLLRAVEQARDELAVRSRGGVYAIRNLLSVVPAVTEWANSAACRELVEPVLGPTAQAVRGILFDKTPEANWKVPWHQDLTIAVRKRAEVAGYGPWTVKAGVPHVQPPVAVLERMLAVRLHLDNCGEENGPVRVVPGSHRYGRTDAPPETGREVVTCTVARGGVLLMCPLLWHASSPAASAAHRRVIHIEFAAAALPRELEWVS